MRKSQRDEIASLVFSLTDDSVEYRRRGRIIAGVVLWLILSGFTIIAYIFSAKLPMHKLVVIGLGLAKYVPMLVAAYILAKKTAAHYLGDIYELNNEELAMEFIEEVTFGYGQEKITIDEGRISENDETSPIILIGGPGKIQINLGSAALLEKVDGQPHIILPRKEPWLLGRFERIREIGKQDVVGKREYAIIDMQDQFVKNLIVRSRTKDGIPIEVTGIKILFHILRNNPKSNGQQKKEKSRKFNEKAMHSLIYNQTTITPEPKTSLGVGFPWDSTAVPLVIMELENIISSHALSEILSSISQKEVDTAEKNNETIAQMRFELTGQQAAPGAATAKQEAPNFISRDKINERFFQPEFKEKAAELGVEIEWLDLGTWNILPDAIRDKLSGAKDLMRENAKKRVQVEKSRKVHEMNEIMNLVQTVIIDNYEKASSTQKSSQKDLDKLQQLMKDNPELVKDPQFSQLFVKQTSTTKKAGPIAADLIGAFRRELLAGSILIQRENSPKDKKEKDLARIEKALRDMSKLAS